MKSLASWHTFSGASPMIYQAESRLARIRSRVSLTDSGIVHNGTPHVLQKAFSLGAPLEVSVKV